MMYIFAVSARLRSRVKFGNSNFGALIVVLTLAAKLLQIELL